MSRSIRSASLFNSLPLSAPVTCTPHVVLNALRACLTASSTSALVAWWIEAISLAVAGL